MRLRNWALVAAGAVLLVVALISVNRTRTKRVAQEKAAASAAAVEGDVKAGRRRPPRAPRTGTEPTPAPAAGDAGDESPIPNLAAVTGSCMQEDDRHGQVCTDFFSTPDVLEADKNKCRKTRQFVSAVWSDAPCDHASSHGGCWSSQIDPPRVRWFFGSTNADFKPGADTHKVCGIRSLAFKPDGTPVRADGSSQLEPRPAKDPDPNRAP